MKFTVKENIPASDINRFLPSQFVGVFGFSVMFYVMRNNYLNSKTAKYNKAREQLNSRALFVY